MAICYIISVCCFLIFIWQVAIGEPWGWSLAFAIANLVSAIYETIKKKRKKKQTDTEKE